MPHYLILENDIEYFNKAYLASHTDTKETEKAFTYIHVTSVEDARIQLASNRFSGAILDLRLQKEDEAEGNEIARQIHRDYFMPIAVVSGHVDELEEDFQEMAKGRNGFLRVFNKNKGVTPVFEFLSEVEGSGVIQIIGPGGELNKMISDIFWNHLGEVVNQWRGQDMDPTAQKRVLRHAVSHMIGALQSNEQGNWDNFLPGEIYIWPPICMKEMPGHIYKEVVSSAPKAAPVTAVSAGAPVTKVPITVTVAAAPVTAVRKRCFLLVTPYCDLSKMEHRHFIEILPFADFTGVDKTKNLVEKKNHRYHVLPPTSFFQGGIVDFASLLTIPSDEAKRRFIHKGSLIEPFWRELVNRLGAWLGRQGTPEFDKEEVIRQIRPQWSAPSSSAKK